MNNSKLVYGVGLIALSLAVFFLATRAKNHLHVNWSETHWGSPNLPAADSFSITGVKNLNANGSCDIIIIPSDNEHVVFCYDKEKMKNISKIQDSVLTVEFDNNGHHVFNFDNSSSAVVKIYTRSINNIIQEGVGSIKGEGTLIQDVLTLHNEGIGSMKFDVQSKNITVSNEGVGNLDIKGSADSALLDNGGTGSIDAEKLVLRNAVVSNQGIGSINVQASETLDMSNEGVGSIHYSGTAKVLRSETEGVGSINKN